MLDDSKESTENKSSESKVSTNSISASYGDEKSLESSGLPATIDTPEKNRPTIDYMKNRRWFSGRGEFLGRYPGLVRREDPNYVRPIVKKQGKGRRKGRKKAKQLRKAARQKAKKNLPRGQQYKLLNTINLKGNQVVVAHKLRKREFSEPPTDAYNSDMKYLTLRDECQALGIHTGNMDERYKLAMSESELLLQRLMARGIGAATFRGDRKRLEKLVDARADLEGYGPNGYNALTWAVILEDEEILAYLIDTAQCDPDTTNTDGYGPLLAACRRGQVRMARVLLGRGASIELADSEGRTPFVLACRNGHLKLCRVLLELGADIEARAKNKNTAFLEASHWGHSNICEMLLEANCERHVVNARNENALLLGVRQKNNDIVNLLLREKVSCKVPTVAGECPLHIAVKTNNEELVNTLLRCKQGWSTRNTKTKTGYTPLHYAARQGSIRIVEMLIEANVDVNVVTKFGYTPLIWAVSNNHSDVCLQLISNGADKDLCVTWLRRPNVTARVVAAEKGFTNIIRLLMSSVKVKPRSAIEIPYYLLEEGQSATVFQF